MITGEQLRMVMPYSAGRTAVFLQPLDFAMREFDIVSPRRKAAFIAQIAQESGELRYVRELGSHQYLDKYDTGPLAEKLGNTPEDDDDGQRFCGRGLIQVTGRRNYHLCGKALGIDLIKDPSLLETPVGASRSAAWFWSSNGLNELADLNKFGTITKRVNGGYTHLDERLAYWLRALHAFGLGPHL